MKLKQLILLVVPLLALSGCSKASDSDNPQPESHEHTYNGDWQTDPRDHWKVCDQADCNEVSLKAHHEFELVSTVAQTCASVEHKTYRCSVCGYTKVVDGHDLNAHTYRKSIKTPATCQQEGKYLFSCDVCHDEYEQAFTNPNAHHIVEKSNVASVITYGCDIQGCNHEYHVIDAKSVETTAVNKDTLIDVGAVELKDATIAFDETTRNSFTEEVTISAEPKTADELGVSNELKEVIGDNKIIDFSIKNGEDDVSYFTGSVTVSIPYELKEGENPDGIVVWYLQDGEPTPMEATYHDGVVSFETTHFSLYTVVHLTPEEVCKSFGHNMSKAKSVDSDCVSHGYSDHICSRCSYSERETLPLKNHNYEFKTKKDATHSEEGYLEYECSVCHDKYRSSIEKIPNNQQGFYLTFLKSILSSDIAFTGNQKLGTQELTMEGYKGLDLEGLPFSYIRVPFGEKVQEVGQYKGYDFNGDFTRDEGSEEFTRIFSNISEIFALLPGSVDDFAEDFGENHLERFFTKTASNEGFSFSLNKEKISAIFTALKTGTVEDLITEVMGDGGYDWLDGWINRAYHKTLQQVFDELGTKGYIARELYNAFVSIANIVQPNREKPFKTYDEITAGRLNKKIVDILGEELPEGYAAMIPPSYDDAKAMIDSYLDMPAMNIIGMLMSMGGSSHGGSGSGPHMAHREAEPNPLDAYEAVIDTVEINFTTASNGDFATGSLSFADEEGAIAQGMPLSISVQFKKGFDKYAICERLDSYNQYAADRENLYELSSSNYKWFTKPYEDKFNTEFDYVENYGNLEEYYGVQGHYSALMSKRQVAFKTYDSYKDQVVTFNGNLCFKFLSQETQKLVDESRYHGYHYNRGRVVQNINGLGTVLPKDGYGVHSPLNQIVESLFFKYTDSEGVQQVYEHHYPTKGEFIRDYCFEYLYDLEARKMHYTDGSYDYFSAHADRYELCSKEEFIDGYFYGMLPSYMADNFNNNELVFYKKTCQECGRVDYDYTYHLITQFETTFRLGERYYLTKDMNDEALEHADEVAKLEAYYNNGLIQYRVNEEHFNSVRDAYVGNNHRTPDGLRFGNAELEMIKTEVGTCRNNYKVRMYVNNKLVHSETYQKHVESGPMFDSNRYYQYIDECHTREIETNKCQYCGREFYESSNINPHHTSLNTVVEVPATNTAYGYTICKCNACGEFDFDDIHPLCTHQYYTIEEGVFKCNDCDFEIAAEERPVIYIDQVATNSPGWISGTLTFTFSIVGQWYENGYYHFGVNTADYSAQLAICYIDGDGNPQFFRENGEAVSTVGAEFKQGLSVEYEDNGAIYYVGHLNNNYMYFNSSSVNALMNLASLDPDFSSHGTLHYAIMVTDNYTQGEFHIPVYIIVL